MRKLLEISSVIHIFTKISAKLDFQSGCMPDISGSCVLELLTNLAVKGGGQDARATWPGHPARSLQGATAKLDSVLSLSHQLICRNELAELMNELGINFGFSGLILSHPAGNEEIVIFRNLHRKRQTAPEPDLREMSLMRLG
jgi:hypothetical protein